MNAGAYIIEVNPQNFQTEVAEKSKDTPVLLEFYAEGAEQGAAVSELLNRLANEYQGKFILARVNIQENAPLVQQLGVRTLPTIKIIFQGQIAGEIEGPVDEQQLRNALEQLTMSPMERVKEQIDVMIAQGDRKNAIAMLQQVITEEPKNFALHVELCDLLIMEGEVNDARQILDALPDDTAGIEKPKSRLEFIEKAGDLPAVGELQSSVESSPDDLQLRLNLAIRLVVDDQIEQALEELLTIVKKDKTWEDELARKTMIQVFNMLGKGNDLATSYRRKMFTFLH